MKYLVIADDGRFFAKGGTLEGDRPSARTFHSKKRAKSQMRYYKVKGDVISVVDYDTLMRLTHMFDRIKEQADKLSVALEKTIAHLKEKNDAAEETRTDNVR